MARSKITPIKDALGKCFISISYFGNANKDKDNLSKIKFPNRNSFIIYIYFILI